MLQKLRRVFRRDKSEAIIVRFEGGMGSQIFQAATFMLLKERSKEVLADFSYFSREPRIATVGIPGQLSHRPYQLNHFGLPMASFLSSESVDSKNSVRLLSEVYSEFEYAQLSCSALRNNKISEKFPLSQNVGDFIEVEQLKRSVCVHIRRGDYVNVASHLVSLDEFYSAARALSGLSNTLILLSDSPLEESVLECFRGIYGIVYNFDNISAEVAHDMIRLAKGVICSNSTFSLTAALLGSSQVVLLPKFWYAGNSSQVNVAFGELCEWQLMTS